MWPPLCAAAVGVWLMFAPSVLDYAGAAATNDRVIGPLVASFGYVALSAATRGLIRLNAPLGAWLVVAPFVLGYQLTPLVNSVLCGILVLVLALASRSSSDELGSGWTAVVAPRDRQHAPD